MITSFWRGVAYFCIHIIVLISGRGRRYPSSLTYHLPLAAAVSSFKSSVCRTALRKLLFALVASQRLRSSFHDDGDDAQFIVGGRRARPTKYFLFSLEFLTKYCDHSGHSAGQNDRASDLSFDLFHPEQGFVI